MDTSGCQEQVQVVVSTSEYNALLAEARRSRGSFVDHLLAYPGGEIERAKSVPRDVEF